MIIRPFQEDDAPAVAALWQYWFRDQTFTPDSGLVALVRRIFVDAPNADEVVRPLVAVDSAGKVIGFLGVNVTPITVDGAPAKLAGVFPSVIDPSAPTSVATFLLRKFLAGPQAITFSDGGHVKFEKIWETLGGRINHLQSIRWVKVLRPGQLVLSRLSARNSVRRIKPLLRPLAGGVDSVSRRILERRVEALAREANRPQGALKDEKLVREPLTPDDLATLAPMLMEDARVLPIYSEEAVKWQFGEMAKISSQGEFTANLVRTVTGRPVGWYVYYSNPGNVSRVFALEGLERYLPGIVDDLFDDADSRGAGALIGRVEPRLRSALLQRGVFVHGGGSLQMVHSKDTSLMDSAQLGRVAINRLQGENWYWWAIVAATVA